MSEGVVTYVSEGETCGVFTIINSEMRSHKVCDTGLACMYQKFDLNDTTLIKRCSLVDLPPGSACNPYYTNCYAGLECLKNEFEEYSCGGTQNWLGNDDAIDTQIIRTSCFDPSYSFLFIGIILILVDIITYLFKFKYNDYSKIDIYKIPN